MAQLQHQPINPRPKHLNGLRMLIYMLPHLGRDSTVQWISELISVKSNTKQMKTKQTKRVSY